MSAAEVSKLGEVVTDLRIQVDRLSANQREFKVIHKKLDEIHDILLSPDGPGLVMKVDRLETRAGTFDEDLEETKEALEKHIVVCNELVQSGRDKFWNFFIQQSAVILTWIGVGVYYLIQAI